MSAIKPILRSWKNNRNFVIQIVIILSVAIGPTVAVFSFVDAALLRLPFYDPDRIVTVWEVSPKVSGIPSFASAPDFADWKVQTDVFEQMSLYDTTSAILRNSEGVERLTVGIVSSNFFRLLGTNALLGRIFTFEEDKPGSRPVVLSYPLWRRVFHGDRLVIDRPVRLGDEIYTVVGVAPEDFHLFEDVDLWTPIQPGEDDSIRGARHFIALGRLKNHQNIEQVQAALHVVAGRLQKQYSATNGGWDVSVISLRTYLFKNLRSSFVLIFFTSGLVLVVGCFNVANLFLLYIDSRQRSSAIQLALGCSPAQLRNGFLSEFFMLTFAAGILGLIAADAVVHLIVRYAPRTLLHSDKFMDIRVYLFCLAVAFIAGLIPSALSLQWKAGANLSQLLKGTGSGMNVVGAAHRRPRLLFLVFEISMSLVLLISAGVMTKSFLALQRVDPGFNPKDLLTARIQLPTMHYTSKLQQSVFFDQLLASLSARSTVKAAAAVTGIPLGGSRMSFRFWIPGKSAGTPVTEGAEYRAVSPGYFRVLGIPVLEGREFAQSDQVGSSPVVAINEALARKFFQGEDPLGKHIVLMFGEKKPLTIIAVVKDVKYSDLSEVTKYEVYVPYGQNPWPFMTVILQTAGPVENAISTLRQEVAQLDKELPIEQIRTMDQVLYDSMTRPRFATVLILSFSILAVVLSAAGVYSVMSFVVSQRNHEIGIRMAIGASRSSILKLFLLQGLLIILIGVSLGVAASMFTTGLFRDLLYGVHPIDITVYLLVILFLAVVGMIACYLPSRRATMVDPMIVLRRE